MIDPIQAAFAAGVISDSLKHVASHLRTDREFDQEELAEIIDHYGGLLARAYQANVTITDDDEEN